MKLLTGIKTEVHRARAEVDGIRTELDWAETELDGANAEVDCARVEVDGGRSRSRPYESCNRRAPELLKYGISTEVDGVRAGIDEGQS